MAGKKRPIDVLDSSHGSSHDTLKSPLDSSSSQSYSGSARSPHYTSPPVSSARVPKQARTSYDHPNFLGGSQHNAIVIGDDGEDEEEEDASQEAPDASQGYTERQYQYELYGAMAAKVVGVRYYNGVATVGEMCIARREPQNQYDRNAIQILNVRNQQIGHIPRTVASKLAKYMDDHSLKVEAIIRGQKGEFDCPLELRFYGTNEPEEREVLLSRMRSDKLPVTQAAERNRMEAAAVKERQKLAKQAAKQAAKNGERVVGISGLADFAGGPTDWFSGGPTLDKIISGSELFNPRNVEQVVEDFGVKEQDLESMPNAPQPEALTTKLHPFQLQGLQWMLDKEDAKLPEKGSKDVVQLWRRHHSIADAFTNLATNFSVKDPSLASGGILADDMGLGKTIQVIALIMAGRALKNRHTDTCDATLILAPVSVMSNWSTQMKKHIKEEHALRVMFWHGNRKQPITPKEIKNYDIVISTYESISTDWYSQKSGQVPRKAGPFSVKWRRIVLDEGHNIRNPKAKKTIAITNLLAQSRWTLSGTPIINNLKDIYSQVRFLRLSGGLDTFEIFHGAIVRPVHQGDAQGHRLLQMLMSSICLRRKKEMSFIDLRLPKLSEYVHKVKLHAHEQEKYDVLEAQAIGTLEQYKNNHGSRKGADTYRHLLEVLLRMRQLCNHWKLVGDERLDFITKQLETRDAIDLTEENKAALQQMLQLAIDSQEDCPVCLDPLKVPVITKCAHYFCTPCLERVIETQHSCPMCRAKLESLHSTTVKPPKETCKSFAEPTLEQRADKASLEKNTSTKIEALIDILKASSRDPSNKTIIFSQWTSFINILQPHLQLHGFKYTRIDGSMTAAQRDTALEALDNDAETTIMLASLSVCSVGLNLVAANQVIMTDSWWAPAIEDQAVDRVHRLGQRRETTIFRLVVEGSIEERVLGIQEDKRKLMGLAFAEEGRNRRKRGAGAGLGDLSRLIGEASG